MNSELRMINKKHIIHVEDDEIARDVIKIALSPYYKMDFAVDAKEAFHKVKENQYDAILMDINLKSGMDGVELTKEIKKLPGYEAIPVVALTAYAGEFERKEFLSHGLDYFIPKPFTFEEVIDVMKEIFKEKEST